jgi:hypothetical protein
MPESNGEPHNVDDDYGLREGETGFNGHDFRAFRKERSTTSRVILTILPVAPFHHLEVQCARASGGQI